MIERTISQKIRELSRQYPVLFLTGPRQSGKTTLLKHLYPELPYATLEDPDERSFAREDPRYFLERFSNGGILDEVQNVPEIFSYLQSIVDANKESTFILTGSQNFLMLENISQTLAGRTAVLNLLPLSLGELFSHDIQHPSFDEHLFNGFFPGIYDRSLDPADFYSFYIQTYVERDVRQVRDITDLDAFIRFIQLCAGRTGQLLNYSEIAGDCGVSTNTAKAWLSVLQASYVVFLLEPHHKNFNKRLIKMPKLYFYDTGLACSLLRLETAEQLRTYHNRGGLFENFVITEFLKQRYNHAGRNNLYFWRDHHGREIDLLVEKSEQLTPVEIKSGKTVSSDFFKDLNFWNQLAGNGPENTYLVYGGTQTQQRKQGRVFGWKDLPEAIEVIQNG